MEWWMGIGRKNGMTLKNMYDSASYFTEKLHEPSGQGGEVYTYLAVPTSRSFMMLSI